MDFANFRLKQKSWYENKYGLLPLQWGNPTAKIVIIGQAPSRLGQIAGLPFFDKTGEKLRHIWLEVNDDDFYNPDKFYLTALGLVFPGKAKNGGDKKPDQLIPQKWLFDELKYLTPKIFLILGSMAAKYIFPGADFRELIFANQKLLSTSAYVLPHPSPLNIKWFKDNPEFITNRLPVIRQEIHQALDKSSAP